MTLDSLTSCTKHWLPAHIGLHTCKHGGNSLLYTRVSNDFFKFLKYLKSFMHIIRIEPSVVIHSP